MVGADPYFDWHHRRVVCVEPQMYHRQSSNIRLERSRPALAAVTPVQRRCLR